MYRSVLSNISVPDVSISSSHLLTLGLQEGQPVRIVPLGGTAKIAGLPSLKNAKDATDIRLKEIGGSPAKGSDKEKVEWLTLVSREVLGLSTHRSQSQNPLLDIDVFHLSYRQLI